MSASPASYLFWESQSSTMILQTSLNRHRQRGTTAQAGEGSHSLSEFSKCSVAAEHSPGFEKKSLPWRVLLSFCKS